MEAPFLPEAGRLVRDRVGLAALCHLLFRPDGAKLLIGESLPVSGTVCALLLMCGESLLGKKEVSHSKNTSCFSSA